MVLERAVGKVYSVPLLPWFHAELARADGHADADGRAADAGAAARALERAQQLPLAEAAPAVEAAGGGDKLVFEVLDPTVRRKKQLKTLAWRLQRRMALPMSI